MEFFKKQQNHYRRRLRPFANWNKMTSDTLAIVANQIPNSLQIGLFNFPTSNPIPNPIWHNFVSKHCNIRILSIPITTSNFELRHFFFIRVGLNELNFTSILGEHLKVLLENCLQLTDLKVKFVLNRHKSHFMIDGNYEELKQIPKQLVNLEIKNKALVDVETYSKISNFLCRTLAASLERFTTDNISSNCFLPPKLNFLHLTTAPQSSSRLPSCDSLKSLIISDHDISDAFEQSVGDLFPNLEQLKIAGSLWPFSSFLQLRFLREIEFHLPDQSELDFNRLFGYCDALVSLKLLSHVFPVPRRQGDNFSNIAKQLTCLSIPWMEVDTEQNYAYFMSILKACPNLEQASLPALPNCYLAKLEILSVVARHSQCWQPACSSNMEIKFPKLKKFQYLVGPRFDQLALTGLPAKIDEIDLSTKFSQITNQLNFPRVEAVKYLRISDSSQDFDDDDGGLGHEFSNNNNDGENNNYRKLKNVLNLLHRHKNVEHLALCDFKREHWRPLLEFVGKHFKNLKQFDFAIRNCKKLSIYEVTQILSATSQRNMFWNAKFVKYFCYGRLRQLNVQQNNSNALPHVRFIHLSETIPRGPSLDDVSSYARLLSSANVSYKTSTIDQIDYRENLWGDRPILSNLPNLVFGPTDIFN